MSGFDRRRLDVGPAAVGLPAATSIVVRHSPCGGIVTENVRPFSSYFAGSLAAIEVYRL